MIFAKNLVKARLPISRKPCFSIVSANIWVENKLFSVGFGHTQIFFKGKSFSLVFLSHTVLFHNFVVSKFI